MSSTYNGNAGGFNPATGASVTIPSDGDAANAASVNNPGPFEHLTDAIEWFRQNTPLVSAAHTWALIQTFTSGITPGAVTYPSPAVGSFQSGSQKLGYWVNAEGSFKIQGSLGSLSIAGSGGQSTVWAAATVPSAFRPANSGGFTFSALAIKTGSTATDVVVEIQNDGSLTVTNKGATGTCTSIYVELEVRPDLAYQP